MGTNPEHQGMSAEEIALLDELDDDGLPPEDEATPAEPTPPEEAPADDEDEPTPTPPATAATPAPAPDPATVAAPAPEPAPAEPAPQPAPAPAPFVPRYTAAEVPADAEQQIAALRAEEQEAFSKVIGGDLEPEAYQAIRTRTDAAIEDLRTRALTSRIFTQANEQAAEQAAKAEWLRECDRSMAGFKAEGLDYRAKPALMAAFDTNLKALAADPANAEKDARWFLSEANRRTREDLGLGQAKTPAPAPTPKPASARGVDKDLIPPTLSNVPQSAAPTIEGDEFAHLANLSGVELERAVAKMTPEQQERWLN